jgi:hypothetical protein
MIVIAIISNEQKLSGKLSKFFAGSPAYHIAFVDLEKNKMYDMNLLFRRRIWPHYPEARVTLYKSPVELTGEYLEYCLDTDEDWYGVLDYLAFGWKKLFNTKNVPSFKGAVCSEKISDILISKGWVSPFKNVPSPTDFENILEKY